MNLKDYLDDVSDYFSPQVIGEVNDVYVKVAKIKGDKVPWHKHLNEDELFYIIKGSLLMEIEGENSFVMNTGDMYIVNKGISHRVSSTDECQIMLIENKVTAHTGDVQSDITKPIGQQLKSK